MRELHARLSPSNHRWPHCPGSVKAESGYEDSAGEAAIDGTGSHLLLEMCLKNGVLASAYVGQVIGVNHEDSPNGWMVQDDRAARVQQCLDYIRSRYEELAEQFPGSDISIEAESKSDPGGAFGRDDWHGTCDVTIIVMNGAKALFIETIDYKDGRGFVTVYRENSQFKLNTQLASYMFGKLRDHVASGPERVRPFVPTDLTGCRLTIVQPKTNPTVRKYDCRPEFVIAVAEDLAAAANKTDQPDAPLIAGDHCQWCKASPKRGGHCTAGVRQSMENIMSKDISFIDSSTDLVPLDTGVNALISSFDRVAEMSGEELSKLSEIEASLMASFDQVRNEIERRIKDGEHVPGWAIKPGNGKYVWNADEEAIAAALKSRRLKKDEIYPAKLISPAQVEKLSSLTTTQKEKIRKDYVTYLEGSDKLTMVAHDEKKDVKSIFDESPAPLTFL